MAEKLCNLRKYGGGTAPMQGADLIAVAKSSYLWFIDLVNNKSIRALTGSYTVCNNVTLTIIDGATCKFNANASVERTVDTPVGTVNNSITVSYTANNNFDVNDTGISAFTFS